MLHGFDCWPVLQVALDHGYSQPALDMAKILRQEMEGLYYLVEAGTPTNMYAGIGNFIPALRKVVGKETQIVVDTKAMDVGKFVVDLVQETGADIVGIAGAAPTETVEAALDAAEKYCMAVEIDSISTLEMSNKDASGPINRFEWIVDRLVRYNKDGGNGILEFHIPIDRQKGKGGRDFSLVEKVYKSSGIPIAAAGGLNAETIPQVIGYGAKILVVGGAITRAPSPREAVREIRDIIYKEKTKMHFAIRNEEAVLDLSGK